MTKPLISVIMPSLNQAAFLEEAIRSVLEQDYPAKELIVVDGGSTDGSAEIIARYGARLRHWESAPDNGQSDAINKGLARAGGEVVTWLNSDDRYRPGTLARVAEHFRTTPGTAILHGRSLRFGTRRRSVIIGPETTLQPHEHLPYMRFPQPAAFFRREAIEGGVNPLLHYAMDFEMVVQNVLMGRAIDAIPDVLADYRLHAASKTNAEGRFLEEWTLVFLRALHSVENGGAFSERLETLAQTRCDAARYPVTVKFTAAQLRAAFLEHLHFRFHYHYRRAERTACETIAAEVRDIRARSEKTDHYSKYLRRLRYFPNIVRLKNQMWP